jgi:hypothetical protein
MSKVVASLAFFLVLLSGGYAQTVALAFHSSLPGLSRPSGEQIQTGALDILYSMGLIVTTAGSSLVTAPLDLPGILSESEEGRVEWLVLLDAKAGNASAVLPETIAWKLIRVRGAAVVAEGDVSGARKGASPPTDPVQTLRALGGSAARSAVVSLNLQNGGRSTDLSPTGGW